MIIVSIGSDWKNECSSIGVDKRSAFVWTFFGNEAAMVKVVLGFILKTTSCYAALPLNLGNVKK